MGLIMTDKRKHIIYWSIAVVAVFTFVVVMKMLQKPPATPEIVAPAPEPSAMKPLPVSEPVAELKSEYKAPEPAPEPCPETVPVKEALDAIMRAHPGSTMVCYDNAVSEYYVHYPESNGDEYMNGWYRIAYPTMNKSANGTYWVDDRPLEDYTKFYPNVKGLPCKK